MCKPVLDTKSARKCQPEPRSAWSCEQSSVAEHINQQVVEIADGAADTQRSSEASLAASERLHATIGDVNGVIKRFNFKGEIG